MITIYSKTTCSFCDKAKELLDIKGLKYKEKIVGTDITKQSLLELVPTAKTVPQIFNNSEYIGGFSELKKWLEKYYEI